MESETVGTEQASAGLIGWCAALAGLAAMGAAFALEPFGPPVVLLSWCLVVGGLVLAVLPRPVRPLGLGLAVAGLVPPFVVFLWIWVAISIGVLDGSVR